MTNSGGENLNPYETSTVSPSDKLDRTSFRFSATFILALVLNGVLFVAVLLTQNRFENILMDFDVELSTATVIALSPWIFLMIGSLFLFTVVKELVYTRTKLARICNAFACLAVLIIGSAYAVALFLSLLPLIEDLS